MLVVSRNGLVNSQALTPPYRIEEKANAMNRFAVRLSRGGFLSLVATLLVTMTASANDYDLLLRAPESANALILANVEELLRSPLALREKWRDQQGSTERPVVTMAPDIKHLLLLAKVNFAGRFANEWDVALAETTHDVSMALVARAEGGYVDTVEGMQTAYSPRDAFFVSLTPRILGAMFPANRQDLAHWLRGVKERNQPSISPYLKEAVDRSQGGAAPFTMAMDLDNLLTLPQVRARLRKSEALRVENVDREAVARVLTSLKGVKFTVVIDNYFNGKLRVDFGESTVPLSRIAKPLLFEVLDAQGLMHKDFNDWRILVAGKTIALEGRLSLDGLRMITDLIPVPAGTLPTAATGSPGTPASSEPSMAETSKKYFKQLTERLDDLKGKAKDSQVTDRILLLTADRYAQEIDRFPILNVDPDLLDFGSAVSETLRSLRNRTAGAGMNASLRQTNLNYGGYAGGYFYGNDRILDTELIKRQEKISLKVDRTQVWTDVENKTSDMRKKLTLKYKVEF
jgi:hypothetical protein